MESLTKIKPDFYREINNNAVGLKGYIVIDRQLNGAATGGIRMAPNVTLDEVANLAHEMTLKYAFFKVKKDGAKAGIVALDVKTDQQKKQLCKLFGEEIRDLIKGEKYFPGQDLGINSPDLAEVLSGAGIDAVKREVGIDSAYFTALTVYLALVEILDASQIMIKDTSLIIEGFGKVGERLAKIISETGAKIKGISTAEGALYDPTGLDLSRLFELKSEHGDDLIHHYDQKHVIEKEKLIFKDADIFIPGARPDSITQDNVDKLQFKVIVPIANIAATEEVEHLLSKRGIEFMPGFVSNAGGILSYFFEEQGFDGTKVKEIILKGFPRLVRKTIEESKSSKKSVAQTARAHVLKNLQLMEKERMASSLQKISVQKILWILFKILEKIHLGGFLLPFAINYINHKHFD